MPPISPNDYAWSMVISIHVLGSIWVNYNISLTWIVGPFGDDFQPSHDSSEGEQWGRDEIYPDQSLPQDFTSGTNQNPHFGPHPR